MKHVLRLAVLLVLTWSGPAAAQEVVFVIRHGEKALGDDPDLMPGGRERAARWAAVLAEAGLTAIIASDARRTQQTAGIIGQALGLTPAVWPRDDIAGLVDMMDFDYGDARVLVVAHSETIGPIVRALGGDWGGDIDPAHFGSLMILRPWASAPVHLHFP